MSASARLDFRLSARDKHRITRAADLRGVPVSAFVRDAALREAENVMTVGSQHARDASLAARLRGRATTRMSTNEIMRLTRGE